MAHFYPLKVANIKKENRDAVVLTLVPSKEARDKFSFIQGQYLTFRKEFEGEELRRSYSICAGVNDNELRVGIKKVDGGWFSTWANQDLKVGDTLESMVPNGRFYTAIEPKKDKHYLAFAGGSGITPMISIIKTVMENEPLSTLTLIYGNRSANTIMFKEELDDLKNIYMERFSLLHVLEHDAGDIDLFNGRVDREKCDRLFSTWIDVKAADTAFICGPEPMMLAIKDGLVAHGMNEKNVKFELFKSVHPKKAKSKSSAKDDSQKKIKATFIIDGFARVISMPAKNTSVLEAAMEANIDVPFSCRAGVCSTCSAKVLKGEVEMASNYGLEDYEVERGLVLTCQSFPLTDEITIDYDQH